MRQRQLLLSGVALATTSAGYLFLPPLGLLTTPLIVYLEWPLYQATWRDLTEKHGVKIDGLMAIFTTAAWLTRAYVSSALSIFMLVLSETITARTRARSQQKLVAMFDQQPHTVWVMVDGVEVEVPFTRIQVGDTVIVNAGQMLPVDGVILAGHAGIDQHMLTGEAQPVDKEAGDTVFASTLVLMGEVQVQVAKANADTLAAQITIILNNTKSHNTQMGLRGVEIADRWVYATTAIGLLALPIWGVSTMLAVWSVQLGSMLMFSTPLTLLGYLDVSARSNILVKDGRSLELLSSIDTVVFDKTGTLTLEQPTVCAVHRCGDLSEDDLLALAAAIEHHQAHPVAAAIRTAATTRALPLSAVDKTRIEVGYGLAVTLNERRVLLGSQRYMNLNHVPLSDEVQQLIQTQQAGGHSLVYLAVDGVLQGMIELQPTLRPEAQAVVTALHGRGLQLVMITGDQEAPAQALAATLGIDRVYANVLPERKAELVKELQAQGRKVMFVGDGINDSIALKQAHVSVSIAGATSVATDTAQIVLMDSTLAQLDTLFDLATRYERDLRAQYVLGVYIPAGCIAGVLAFGWGMVTSYVVGYIVFLTATGLAFRPIWRQERMEAKSHLLVNGNNSATIRHG